MNRIESSRDPWASHIPGPRRLLWHAAIIGLLATGGFAIGRVVVPRTFGAALVLAIAMVIGYALGRLIWRLQKIKSRVAQRRKQSMDAREADFRQAEALASLTAIVKPNRPLPPMRGWAMSPDILCEIATTILDSKPTAVVEASSGVSTLVIAYCLQQIGSGTVTALEHDAEYAAVTAENLRSHGLQKFAQVIHSPLIDYQINEQVMKWYDISQLQTVESIDLLVIDGPPAASEADILIRFPALPLLYDRLASRCEIILDDAHREGERQIIQSWIRQFPSLSHRTIPCEKGASILFRTHNSR